MTVGADLDMNLFLSALRLKDCSTGAFDDRFEYLGVNILFHLQILHLSILTGFPVISTPFTETYSPLPSYLNFVHSDLFRVSDFVLRV